jgi:non-homologous end joining protein Ku
MSMPASPSIWKGRLRPSPVSIPVELTSAAKDEIINGFEYGKAS